MTKREASFWASKTNPDISQELALDALTVSADIIICLSADQVITDIMINPENETAGCLDHWVGRNIRKFLTEECVEKFEMRLAEVKDGRHDATRSIELNHQDGARWEIPFKYNMLSAGNGEQLLLVGHDLSAISMIQQDLVQAQFALERDFERSRDFQTRYRAIMETARDALILVSSDSGRIEDINSAAAKIFVNDANTLKGADFLSLFDTDPQITNLEAMISRSSDNLGNSYEFRIAASSKPVLLLATPVRAAGRKFYLCQLESTGTTSARETGLSEQLALLFDEGTDSIVFTDGFGTITNCNTSFLDLSDSATLADIMQRPLAEFLKRGSLDQRMLLDGVTKSGQVRSFNTEVVTSFRGSVPVNVSASRLKGVKSGGFAFVIRIMSGQNADLESGKSVPKSASQNVIKLVGSAPLKEIVAGTADVIEKLCIESALSITGNNRVATAEMLGLSRQSLYVKLRKYGMLESKSQSDD